MADTLKMAVLVSGGGTNLQAIIDAIKKGSIEGAEITAVISNNPNAYALRRAENENIPACAISPKDFTSREEFNKNIIN